MAEASRVWTLLGLREPGRPGRIIVWDTEEISVGRSSESDIVIDDSDASRRHALFVRLHAGYQVQDLGTANGTQINKATLDKPHMLSNKDIVQIGELQITFIQTRKDPSGLGLETDYASNLKTFAGAPPSSDPGATTLGLVENVGEPFRVGAVGDFDYTPPGDASAAPRDLDSELADFASAAPAQSSPRGAKGGAMSVHLELEGLTPDLQRAVHALLEKVIELPALRIRIKGD